MTQVFNPKNQDVAFGHLQLQSNFLQTTQDTCQVLQVLLVISANDGHVVEVHDDVTTTLQQDFHFTLKNRRCGFHTKWQV